MKLQFSEIPITKTQRKIPIISPLIALTILLTISLYYPSIEDSYRKISQNSNNPCSINGTADSRLCNHQGGDNMAALRSKKNENGTVKCDLFTGEWVPNPRGPDYSNETCRAIQEHQNCMKYGRPDMEFLKWRWKPDGCELPGFDPTRFLELVKGKSMAFVGDSVARNHMQSLICLLSKVEYPKDLTKTNYKNKHYVYSTHDFNISVFWSPYLVRTGKLESDKIDLYLDEFDKNWTTKIAVYDYIIMSAGHWFYRPTYFHLNNSLIGCLHCTDVNVTKLTAVFSYRQAFQTAFRAINGAVNFNGVTFLRTFSPGHYEGGEWNDGGDCVRTTPFRRNETALKENYFGLEMYMVQLEELRIAQKAVGRTGGRFRLFDMTKAMVLRPDGHPSKYGHLQGVNQTNFKDCVHWCLPGPIDSWNDILQELLIREIGNNE